MPAGTWDFTIEQGSTFVQQLVWTDDSNNPVPMTGCTAHMQIRNGPPLLLGETDILYLDMTSGAGQIQLGSTDGTITLILTADETAALIFKVAQYDLHIISPSGAVLRILQGKVTLSPEVTIEGVPGDEVIAGGSGPISVKTVSANYTLSIVDYVVLVDPTTGPLTISLPTAKSFSDVYVIAVVGTGTNLVTLDPNGVETISGNSTVLLGSAASQAAFSSVTLISDLSNWWVI